MSESHDRQARKEALAKAKERLAKRKREREALRELREQRKAGGVAKANIDYGLEEVASTKRTIDRWTKESEAKPSLAAAAAAGGGPSVPGRRAQLAEVSGINTVNIGKRQRETYTKGVSTDGLEIAQDADLITEKTTEEEIERILIEFMNDKVKPWPPSSKSSSSKATGSAGPNADDDLKLDDLDAAAAALEEKKVSPSPDPVMSEEDALALTSGRDFKEPFELKARWMNRALAVNNAHLIFAEIDIGPESQGGSKHRGTGQEKPLEFKREFASKSALKRSVTYMDWSTLNRDTFLCAHAANDGDSYAYANTPDGSLNIWNVMLPDKPEYSLECQSMISVAKFHPTDEAMIIGATMSGQIVAWDKRVKNTPQFRSRSGHIAPVYTMEFLPTTHRKMVPFLTVSNDGRICLWNDDFLVEPKTSSVMKLKESRADELPTTCFSFPPKDSKQVILGCDEGSLYKVDVHSQAQSGATIVQDKVDNAHDGPITNIQFHPIPPSNSTVKKVGRSVEMCFLTSSYDWTVKLWHCGKDNPRCLGTFREMDDYVYDVKWSPSHPSTFACGDGSGKITVFDLSVDFESPISEPLEVSKDGAITSLIWAPDGKHLVAGDSQGVVRMFEVSESIYGGSEEDYRLFEENIKARVSKV